MSEPPPSPPRLRLSFGKYAGYYVEEVHLDYLSWLLSEECQVHLGTALRAQIREVLTSAGYPENGHRRAWAARPAGRAVDAWPRQLLPPAERPGYPDPGDPRGPLDAEDIPF